MQCLEAVDDDDGGPALPDLSPYAVQHSTEAAFVHDFSEIFVEDPLADRGATTYRPCGCIETASVSSVMYVTSIPGSGKVSRCAVAAATSDEQMTRLTN
jgi:hypothetical protein